MMSAHRRTRRLLGVVTSCDELADQDPTSYLHPLWNSLAGQVLALAQDGGSARRLVQGKNILTGAAVLSSGEDATVLIVHLNRAHPVYTNSRNAGGGVHREAARS